ncbi:MAG: InlB B-repeat-containing protein [Gaiellaceae bacterium]
MKIAAGIATVLALACAAGSSARVAGSSAAAVSRNMVVVSTTANVVNGNVSSLSALKAKPGRDGISLREALSAANRTGGSATVYVMFSARLNGKTIQLRTPLPPLRRDHLVLEGVAPDGSPARVSLSGRHARLNTLNQLLLIQGSEITVRWLRFTGINPTGNHSFQEPAIWMIGGQGFALTPGPTRQRLANVQIVDDVFDSRDINFPNQSMVGPSGVIVFAGPNAQMSGITIARNTFLHETGSSDSVGIWANSSGAKISGVLVEHNAFDRDANAVELADTKRSPRLTGTRIIGNTITRGGNGITLDGNAMNGAIDDTLIEGNSISDTSLALNLDACAFDPRLAKAAFNDVISNTQIVNNDIRDPDTGIRLAGGNTTTCASRVAAVTIENDTFVKDEPATVQPGNLFTAIPNGPGAGGNRITNVIVRNSILYWPSGTPIGQQTQPVLNQAPDVVTNSLVSGPGWAGTNGNISGDPKFVNESGGDYHLAVGSPLINAGTTIGAPGYDLDGARRDAQPDFGAFEFGAVARPLLTVIAEQLGGSGTVTSSPSGINCGTACSARFDPGTTVTLTAKPNRQSRFLGWRHGCSGVGRCTITIDGAKSVTARFAP